MNRLPLPNLPASKSPAGSYERLLAVKLNEILTKHRQAINSLLVQENIPVYANNAAAIAGGLVVGQVYRTGADPDPICVVH